MKLFVDTFEIFQESALSGFHFQKCNTEVV